MEDKVLPDNLFEKFSSLIYKTSGIYLTEVKKELFKARTSKILRKRGITDYKEYYDFVVHDKSGEALNELIDAISTNVTYFFREDHHFEFIKNTFIKELPTILKNRTVVKGWSAGCSSGEEPYSIIITFLEYLPPQLDIELLATDISKTALEIAMRAIYPIKSIENLPLPLLKRYFLKGKGSWEGYVKVKRIVTSKVKIKFFNLLDPFDFGEKFDFIFCRNVMIYFDRKTQHNIVKKFHNVLNENGYLFIGHSESLTNLHQIFKYISPSIYKKI